MINFISSWVQGIIVAVIISTIIEMILPNGNIKKYVRTVIGAYIVFVIVSPIITKITGKEFNLGSYKLPEMEQSKQTVIDTNTYIENTYINKIKQDIIENIEKKGYKVIKVTIDIDKTEENYGNINGINLKLSKKDKDNVTNTIEPIEININDKAEQNESLLTEEIQELKSYLKTNYGTENIVINNY